MARYGGEEIILLLRGTRTLEKGLVAANKIRNDIEKHIVRDGDRTYKVTVSLGIVCFKDTDTEDTIIERADKGLYKAKSLGRNRVETGES